MLLFSKQCRLLKMSNNVGVPRPSRNRTVNHCRGLRVLIFILLIGLSYSNPTVTSDVTSDVASVDIACSSVKYAYTAKGIFREEDVPQEAIPGEHLRICERGMTCCTQEMEYRLSTRSKAEFDKLLKNTVGELKNVYGLRAQRFDDFFRDLLDRSKKDFHKMFLKTYGLLYETNSYLFEDMFKDLENYYENGNVDLTDALENFFNRLYKKMFQVLNGQYAFSEKYLNCVGEQMEALKPFGDIPKKLTMEVKRSFVATKTFHQALNVGRDVLKVLADVGPTPECSVSLMKMNYCPHCRGLPDLKPCSKYCLDVMNECLAQDTELDMEWRNYTLNLDSLGGRLETSFNIESVVDPIDIKISEAIMNFQENGPAVSHKLFETCGRPRLGKRSPSPAANSGHLESGTSSSEVHFEKLKLTSAGLRSGGGGGIGGVKAEAEEETMASLVQSIRKKIKRSTMFWNQLPSKLCKNPEISGGETSPEKECWNGKGQKSSDLEVPIASPNPALQPIVSIESKLESSHQNAIINQQILTLKLITNKLHHAYNGLDVVWQDEESEWTSSGSGSGSGVGPPDENEVTDGINDIYFSSSTPDPKILTSPKKSPTKEGKHKHQKPSSALCLSQFYSWRTNMLLTSVIIILQFIRNARS